MKALIIAVVVTALLGGMHYLGLWEQLATQKYTSPEETATSTVETFEDTVPVDVLDEAQEALDRANKIFDEEEARLLEERAAIDARLEEIVKKRSAF